MRSGGWARAVGWKGGFLFLGKVLYWSPFHLIVLGKFQWQETLYLYLPYSGSFFFPQYNVVKKWLEVEIAPDIRGRIPLLLTSLSFKVSVLEIPGEGTQAP